MGPFCPHRQSGGHCRTHRNRVRQVGLGAAPASVACVFVVFLFGPNDTRPTGPKVRGGKSRPQWTQSTGLSPKTLGPPPRCLHTSVLLTARGRGALGPDLTPCTQLPRAGLATKSERPGTARQRDSFPFTKRKKLGLCPLHLQAGKRSPVQRNFGLFRLCQ